MAELSAVALAAGLGRRYGGPKQRDPLGPGGTTLLDFSLYDAWRAGIRSVVFVVHPDMVESWGPELRRRYGGRLEVGVVAQRIEDLPAGVSLPPGRGHPWGTTQAVLAARHHLSGPFLVLNADDCYGPDALRVATEFLVGTAPEASRAGVVAYRLAETLSPAAGVNRAVLEVDAQGLVHGAAEIRDLRAAGLRVEGRLDGLPVEFAGEALVSMNLWAFTRTVLPILEAAFRRFLASAPAPEEECALPTAVTEALRLRLLQVQALPTSSRWCGVTAPADRESVSRDLASRVSAGEYPEQMWP
jgi:hypothetical protein